MTTVSAVVPTLGVRDTLGAALGALGAEAGLGEIVVAWDRPAGTAPPPGFPEAQPGKAAGSPVVRHAFTGGGRGPGAARNAGAAAARGELLVFVDDDVIVERGAVAALLRCCEGGRSAAVGRIVRHPDVAENLYTRFAYAGAVHRSEPGDLACGPLEFCSALAALPRRVFQEQSGFDERIGIYYEDTELAWRLQQAGMRLCWCRDAVGLHLREMDRRWLVARCRSLGAQIGRLGRLTPAFAGSIRVLPGFAAPLASTLGRAWPALRRLLPLLERLPPPLGLRLLKAAYASGILHALRAAHNIDPGP